jgi:hypothetical protein
VADYTIGAVPPGVPGTPGVHPLDGRPGAAARRVAVNVDPREVDPARLSVEDFEGAVTRLKGSTSAAARIEATEQENDQHLWQYAIALMILTLVVEGFVAARTA